MAEEPVTKWWAVGAKDEATVRKYVSFLYKHSMFGGHVGLHSSIRNEKPNRSLDSTRGMYDMLEVYTLSGVACQVGSVVNFYTEDTNNTEGATYVYPCNDTSKPMGYMVTRVEPDVYGICVVSGILEVPLDYEKGSTIPSSDYRDYVEYDIVDGAFKFSDSGYPVFNVYQDVDGDWIAIILFGNTSSGSKYDGQFAVSVAGVTGSTTFVDVLGGNVFFNDVYGECSDLDTSVALVTGESLWLETTINGNTQTYDFISQSTTPIDGSTVFYTKIAENNNGEIRQIHYGDIKHSRTKLIAGSTNVHIYPTSGVGDVILSVDEVSVGGGTFYTPDYSSLAITGSTIPEGRLGNSWVLPVKAGTVGFFDDGGDARGVWTDITGVSIQQLTSGVLYSAPKDGWLRISVIDGGTSSGACLSIQDSSGNMPIYKYGDFGSTVSSYVYDGAFAVSIDHPDEDYPEVWVNCVGGNVLFNDLSGVCPDVTYTSGGSSNVSLEYGKSLWLCVSINNGTALNYSYLSSSSVPIDGSTVFYTRLADLSNDGKLTQIQYGDIKYSRTKLIGNERISVNPSSGLGDVNINCNDYLHSYISGSDAFLTIEGSTSSIKLVSSDSSIQFSSGGNNIINIRGSTSGGVGSHTGNHFSYTEVSGTSWSGVLQAEKNCIYNILTLQHASTFSATDLKNKYQNSITDPAMLASIDDYGCLLIELPINVTDEFSIDFLFLNSSVRTVFASPEGLNIIDKMGGANTNCTQPHNPSTARSYVRMIHTKLDSDYPNGCWYYVRILGSVS